MLSRAKILGKSIKGAFIMNKNQVALITGCSSGLGRALCNILSSRGYTVIASARHMNKLDGVKANLKVEIDVTDRAMIKEAVQRIMEAYGKIDILVNNAGYTIRGALEEINPLEVSSMFDVNVFGSINMIQAVVPFMRQACSGKVINIGSISGTFSQALNGSYCASKFAVEAINDALRLELHEFGVQSTVIEPGGLDTNFFTTLERNSARLMENENSPYYKLYSHDIQYRQNQKRTASKKVAKRICDIIAKEKLKPRYKVAVPLDLRIASVLPGTIREWVLLHH